MRSPSSYKFGKAIGVTQDIAWFMLERLRYAVGHKNYKLTMGKDETIELDETFVGGKNKNRHR